jgi:hypothetical protein
MNGKQFVNFAENKYNRLLTVVCLLLLAIGLPDRYDVVKAIGFILCLAVMLIIVYQIKPNYRLIRFYFLLVVGNVFLIALQSSGLPFLESHHQAQIVAKLVLLVTLGIPILLIENEVFRADSVTGDTLKGGIVAYLLIAFLWAIFYDILYNFSHSAFTGISLSDDQADLLHFSFTTLTTLGYGDIQPMTALARIAADLEAVVGVMYPSIFIARLVSSYETRSKEVS